jgi:translation initiation factor IF-3
LHGSKIELHLLVRDRPLRQALVRAGDQPRSMSCNSRRRSTRTTTRTRKIDPHDYENKKDHVVRFLGEGAKVKIKIRGGGQLRLEQAFRLLQRLAEHVSEHGLVESAPQQNGPNVIMVLGPRKQKSKGRAEVESEKQRRVHDRQARGTGREGRARRADPAQ